MTPLVKQLTVAAPVEHAWKVFTDGITTWWPIPTHSVEPERVSEVVFEARPGGRIFERWDDGTECAWGEVDLCEPPHRVRFSWRPNHDRPAATEVEVTFTARGSATDVRLEHRGWERLGDEGAESRADYEGGWEYVLGRFADGAT
jgi:uncharacterized protein YndB with AHSA1/START domain